MRLQQLAGRSQTGVHTRGWTAVGPDSRPNETGVGCDPPSEVRAAGAEGHGSNPVGRASPTANTAAVRFAARAMARQEDSEIFRTQASALGNPSEHAGAKFVVIVEGKHTIGPAGPRSSSIRKLRLTDLQQHEMEVR
jgi:hypothetical protein